jgi:hypothetical protein
MVQDSPLSRRDGETWGNDMHWTLDPKRALSLAMLWAAAAALLAWSAHPIPIGLVAAGLLLGIPLGVLQRRSLAEAPAAFRQASTARQVRTALTSTRSGRLALRTQWVSAAILLAGSLLQAVSARDAVPSNPAIGAVAAYLSLMFTRDLFALPALRALGTNAPEP